MNIDMNFNSQERTTMTIKITDQARALPLYQHARSEGQAIGLRLALEALTAETARQEERAALEHHVNPHAHAASRHELTIAALRDVSKVVAERFRA